MKVLSVSFANLNSLAGTWTIDFTDPAFRDGLFLITGQTGAGKTTILDAISLALYGCTVRQEVSKSCNEVMTRGTNQVWAEVDFLAPDGRRYRARWAQRRATGKDPFGLATHSVLDVAENKVLCENKLNDAKALIESITGLTFAQFQRTMMLAQGKFDQFLTAKDNDRAEILEQATGTEAYAQLGQRIFEAKQDADGALKTITEQLEATPTFTDGERAERVERRKATQAQAADLSKRFADAQKRVEAYDHKRKAHVKAQADLEHRAQVYDAAVKAHVRADQVAQEAQIWANEAEKRKQQAEPQIVKAIALAKDFALAKANAEATGATLRKTRADLRRTQGAIETLGSAIAEAQAQAELLGAVLRGEPTAKPAKGTPAADYLALCGALAKREAAVQETQAAADTAQQVWEAADKAYAEQRPLLEENRDNALNALLFAKASASFEEQRKALRDGEPCPLCGALEHPFARGNLPKLSDCERKYKAAQKALDKAEDDHAEARKAADQARAKAERAQKTLEKDREKVQTLRVDLAKAAEAAAATAKTKGEARDMAQGMLKGLMAEEQAQAQADRAAKEKMADCAKALDALGIPDPEAARKALDQALAKAQKGLQKAVADQSAAKTAEEKALAERETATKALAQAKAELDAVLATLPDPEALRQEAQALDEARTQAEREVGQINQELAYDDEKRTAREELLKKHAEATLNAKRWENLNKWLGGQFGNNFRRYAQGITLRTLLLSAGPHLKQMSAGRYSLTWVASSSLLPQVVDADQFNVVRPVTNLSGGERFQVSLALALGLSEMSGARLHVDTLFLDEGFGSLDQSTLSAALDTLCRVQQEGKLIGVISHVSEVAERIPAQIGVRKNGNGRSVIFGPGVSGSANSDDATAPLPKKGRKRKA